MRVSKTPAFGGDGFEVRHAARVDHLFKLFNRHYVGQVAFVVLDDVGYLVEVAALLDEVYLHVVEALDVGVHPLHLRVRDKDYAVNAL